MQMKAIVQDFHVVLLIMPYNDSVSCFTVSERNSSMKVIDIYLCVSSHCSMTVSVGFHFYLNWLTKFCHEAEVLSRSVINIKALSGSNDVKNRKLTEPRIIVFTRETKL